MNNFGWVHGNIWRGSQPLTPFDKVTLDMLNVDLIYKVNSPTEFSPAAEAELLGPNYSVQQDEQLQFDPSPVRAVIAARQVRDWSIASTVNGIYVHCVHGRDRTGLVVGALRLLTGWTLEKTLDEFHAFMPRGVLGVIDRIADTKIEECLTEIARQSVPAQNAEKEK